jgi:hypothetical protein
MNATESNLQKLAKELGDAFVQDKRNDGTMFYHLKDGSPQWMTDAIHKAHDELMPDDWIYEQCYHLADSIAQSDPDKWDDYISEWADSLVDVYNADRTKWLASNLYYGAYVDEAVEELGHSDQGIFGDIGIGQYRMTEQIAYALIQGIRDEAEQLDADEEE